MTKHYFLDRIRFVKKKGKYSFLLQISMASSRSIFVKNVEGVNCELQTKNRFYFVMFACSNFFFFGEFKIRDNEATNYV